MKINEKNLAAFASSGSQVDREGYLMKKGDGSKGYSKRWFVLKGNLLFYFEKSQIVTLLASSFLKEVQ